ncbi:hypothetical protein C8N46_107231 [Kordia periserrulae]|uniref:Uncharacterized protein n=1 Tax=Kordia periserrulae TaxID=701523 RepID=A0A2T6BVW6_9FLAO|nr:hypothetical protein [Kordia periserrulae]PTX60224.1 hypothetical protein C8N46_107231 [Kordia periserrulae]
MEQFYSKIKLRILKHIEDKGISKRQFYIETGISNGVLDKKTGLTELNIEKYLNTYEEINPTWLLTGKGNMYVDNYSELNDNYKNSDDFSLALLNALVNDSKVKQALKLIIRKEINDFATQKSLDLLKKDKNSDSKG